MGHGYLLRVVLGQKVDIIDEVEDDSNHYSQGQHGGKGTERPLAYLGHADLHTARGTATATVIQSVSKIGHGLIARTAIIVAAATHHVVELTTEAQVLHQHTEGIHVSTCSDSHRAVLDLGGLIADDLCRVVLIAGIGLAEVEQADLVALLGDKDHRWREVAMNALTLMDIAEGRSQLLEHGLLGFEGRILSSEG